MKKQWYEMNVSDKNPKEANISIYGVIGNTWMDNGVTASSFQSDLTALGDVDVLNVHINSGGGSVYEGTAIYNLLKRHKATVNMFVDGLAASIASVILCAGDKITVPANASIMIHNPEMTTGGGVKDMEKAIERLKLAKKNILNIYHQKTKQTLETLDAMMESETWMDAETAKSMGFCDVVESPIDLVASIRNSKNTEFLERYSNVPYEVAMAASFVDENVVDEPVIPAKKENPVAEISDEKLAEMLEQAALKGAEKAKTEMASAEALVNVALNKHKSEQAKKDLDKLVAAGKLLPAKRDELVNIANALGDKTIKVGEVEMNAVEYLQNTLTGLDGHGLLNGTASTPQGTQGKETKEFNVEEDSIPDGVNTTSYVQAKYAEHLMAQDKTMKYRDAIYAAEKSPEVAKVLDSLK